MSLAQVAQLGYLSDWPVLLWYIRQVISQKLFLSLLESHLLFAALLLLVSFRSKTEWLSGECPEYIHSNRECYFDANHTQVWTAYCMELRSQNATYLYDEKCFTVENIGQCLSGFVFSCFFFLRWSTMILVKKYKCIFRFHPRGMFFSVDLVEHLFGLEGYFQSQVKSSFKSIYSEGEIHILWNNVAQNCFQELILPLPGSVNHPVNIPLWECVRHMMFTQ